MTLIVLNIAYKTSNFKQHTDSFVHKKLAYDAGALDNNHKVFYLLHIIHT